MQAFSVLIIGAGKIGAFYDSPENKLILSHAHAFKKHNGFELVGFIDSDMSKAEQASNVWGGKAFISIKEAFSANNIDVVVVAVPDENHYQVLMELSEYPIKLVFAEKPLTKTFKEAQHIVDLYKKRIISLAVNYTRRFVPEFIDLQAKISDGNFGKFLSGIGLYGKGFLHNGSHMIDLTRYLLGDIKDIYKVSTTDDCYEDDPSISATMKINNPGDFIMVAIDSRAYTIFELDLFFQKARIRLIDSAYTIERSTVTESHKFPGYHVLETKDVVHASTGDALLNAANNLHSFLCGNDHLACNAIDGLEAIGLCNSINNGIDA